MKHVKTSLCLVVALSTVLAACGGSGSGTEPAASPGTATQAAQKTEAPVEISVMVHFFSQQPMAADNPVKQAIEKATNSKLNIQWVSSNNYGDKLNVTLASGDIPDLTFINDPFASVVRNMATQGAFWEIGPYIKDYPNLSKGIPETAWDLTKMQDGKNYFIPRPRPSEADSFFIVRKDWLDKLGLKVPSTTDELYQVMKAFAEKDPDGNGKADTVGLTANTDSLNYVDTAFTGVNGKYKWANEQITHVAMLPEYRQSLEFLVKAYKEKLIPADFASMKLTQVNELFQSGKAGMLVEKAGTMATYYDKLKIIDPNFKQGDFYPVTSINGYNPKGPGFSGTLAISKKVSEDKLKRILKVLDTWMNPEVFAYNTYGIEGVHHTVKDGQKVLDTEKLQADSVADLNQILYVADPYASSTKVSFPKEVNEVYAKIQDERVKTSVADISIGLYSPTLIKAGAEQEKKIADLRTKIILGTEPITAWDDYVTKLKGDADLQKICQELTEAYKKRMGK
ncbi:extracellular solute-binding protein [Paenibacillus sp. YN15]|uniref:extracellular solute-binding protein n=1 Tax=Paenibacillus sp. YN15 TaxID=1742774 RepID=UPI000DCE98B0|nr:extracellular solute-binding protein [Paenibacillus sp. YN15]RAU96135.1 ABC transporter substrate-binding protein [Paenibacillus sp. YN15]